MIGHLLTAAVNELRDALNQRDPEHTSHWQTSTHPETGELTVIPVPKEDA